MKNIQRGDHFDLIWTCGTDNQAQEFLCYRVKTEKSGRILATLYLPKPL